MTSRPALATGEPRPSSAYRMDLTTPLLFAITLLVSATLLFLLQPMVGKMLLPKFGGAPAVWNTCMVFFQAALLAGYAYAHLSTTWLGLRRQTVLHVFLLILPLALLPISLSREWVPPGGANPIPWLLGALLVMAGLPFFVIATTAPLLQRWFAGTGHATSSDPYFLYAASNAGSMIALLSYPVLVEPYLPLQQQARLWTIGYSVFTLCILACAGVIWRLPFTRSEQPREAFIEAPRMPLLSRLHWVALAFVPSSLLLSVTMYLSTDISPIPLMWVVPLALYLLSFILAFARLPGWIHQLMIMALPGTVLTVTVVIVSELIRPIWALIPLHLMTFFIIAMVCHGELAHRRPPTRLLTEFYLWISIGGVLGGIFNALVAPVVFPALYEYPLALALACLLAPSVWPARMRRWTVWLDLLLPIAFGILTAFVLRNWHTLGLLSWIRETPYTMRVLPLAVLCILFVRRRLRFGLGVAALFGAGVYNEVTSDYTLHRERDFFGILKILQQEDPLRHSLIHGQIEHGAQLWSPDIEKRRTPLTYYFRNGPIGQVFDVFSGSRSKNEVGVVGLGSGTLAAYGQAGHEMTFFEIDPVVERLARDDNYFTYLQDCRAHYRVVLGDARLSLEQEPDGKYGMLIIDAFSGDAIPVHLLTREAVAGYLRKLRPDGVLVFHISNLYLQLEKVLGNLSADMDLVCLGEDDSHLSTEDEEEGKDASFWVVLARHSDDLAGLVHDKRWKPLPGYPGVGVWTDDYSNLFRVFMWR